MALRPDIDLRELMSNELQERSGNRTRLVEVRQATDDEEAQCVLGEEPKNQACPAGQGGSGWRLLTGSCLMVLNAQVQT